ncbi:hypothetical protein GCM10009828_053510 [Actinoplanes couchii]
MPQSAKPRSVSSAWMRGPAVDTSAVIRPSQPVEPVRRQSGWSRAAPTVKGYVSRLLVKLDCDNRTKAALLGHQAGLRVDHHA